MHLIQTSAKHPAGLLPTASSSESIEFDSNLRQFLLLNSILAHDRVVAQNETNLDRKIH